jgi:hypothetical protein
LQKHTPKHTRLLPVEVQGKPRPEDVEINKFLAIYNKTGNNLALWSALLVCLRHRRPVPDGLAQFFEGIAEKLLQFSADDEKGARQDVADLVLGTKNQGGGPSVFQQFRQILEERQLLELIHSRMITYIVEACPPWTQAQVYERVADETGRKVEYIRKLFERYERDLGSFGISAVREAKQRGGVAEVLPREPRARRSSK